MYRCRSGLGWLSALVSLSMLAGCAGPSRGMRLAATVEPMTEMEFDVFATDVAEQIVTWLERGDVVLPVTIAPPAVEKGSIEGRAVSNAFARRLTDGLSDRLAGAVRFGRTRAGAPRLRSAIRFSTTVGGAGWRQVTFRLWDAASNLELVRGTHQYQPRRRNLASLRRQVRDTRLASRTPKRRATPPAAARRTSARKPAAPVSKKYPSDAQIAQAVEATMAKMPPVRSSTRASTPARKKAARPRQITPRSSHDDALTQAREIRERIEALIERIDKANAQQHAQLPRRRQLNIDRHEYGLAELVQEQAVFYAQRTIERPLGKVIFLDPWAWDHVKIDSIIARPTLDDGLTIDLLARATKGANVIALRVIYLDARGGQVEVTQTREHELSPYFGKSTTLRSSRPGAARFIVLVAKG